MGIYHTGIEILGTEYAFGGNTTSRASGVYQLYPRTHEGFEFKYSIDLGEVKSEDLPNGTVRPGHVNFFQDVNPLIQKLSDRYIACDYDLLLKNCNHFSAELITILYGGK